MPDPLHPLGLPLTVVDRWTVAEYETVVSATPTCEVWVTVFANDGRGLQELMVGADEVDRLCEALRKAKTEALR